MSTNVVYCEVLSSILSKISTTATALSGGKIWLLALSLLFPVLNNAVSQTEEAAALMDYGTNKGRGALTAETLCEILLFPWAEGVR